MSHLTDLQLWYASNCDDEWEHEYGIKIETLDNPGWSVTIDLVDTNLEDKVFQPIEDKTSDESWINCEVINLMFIGRGDPSRLEEIIGIFLDWAKSQIDDWLKRPEPISEEELRRLDHEEFWQSLGEEIGPENCKEEGCDHKRIKLSVMCRRHHFEMVKKWPVPQGAA